LSSTAAFGNFRATSSGVRCDAVPVPPAQAEDLADYRWRPMRLVIVRHAEAAPGEPDELRPLTAEGRDQAKALGDLFRAVGIEPDLILTSPLLRARQTAAALELGKPEIDDRLAPGASPEDVRDAAFGRGETVLVVGHQPDCGEAALALAGREVRFPPAGYCELEL
jgi:phosphohistidine phosphatase